MSAEVFISYSSFDRNRVMPVVESLRSNGISVWVDEGNIHAADLWSEQIVQAIADCRVMVVMLSQNSTDSHNVVKEVMLASEQKKALLPVYLEPADIPAKLQYQLAGIQHLELYGQNEQQVLEDLANGLAKHGISRDGDVTAPQATTVKHHDRPSAKLTPPTHPQNYYKPIAWALLACVVTLFLFKSPSSEPSPSSNAELGRIHMSMSIPEEYPIAMPTDMPFGAPWRMLAISPNGKNMVYVCVFEGERHLCFRSISENTFKLLRGSNGAFKPFFSPDGKWVGFVTENKLKKFELSSGLLKIVCDVKNPYVGAAWGDDGMIYYGDSEGSFFYKISENGGEPEKVTNKIPILNEITDYIKTSSSAGVLFRSPGPSISRGPISTYFIDLKNGNITRLSEGLTPSVYDDYLATAEDGQLRFRKIDFDNAKLIEEPKTVANSNIRYSAEGAQYDLSYNNVMMFLSGEGSLKSQLSILNLQTNTEKPLLDRKEQYGQYSISPDDEKIAVEVVNNQVYDIQILDLSRSRLSTFTNSEHNYAPFWNPDGSKVYYSSNREDRTILNLFEYDFNKRKERKLELKGNQPRWIYISDVSMDGNQLLCFGQPQTGANWALYLVDIGELRIKQLTDNKLNEWGAVFSNDEKWIAYTSEKDMEGSFAIYLNQFPEMDNEMRISSGGGEEPMWLPDGGSVYYRNGSQWMRVPINFDRQLSVGEPELFFKGNYLNFWGPSHDTFADGRILLLKPEKWVQPTKIDVIINALEVEP